MEAGEQRKLIKRMVIIGGLFALAALLFRFGLRGFLVAYVLAVGVLMVLAILLQSGKGGGLASIGGLGGDSILGTRSATPIAKATYVMGALLLFICMLLANLGPSQDGATEGTIGEQEKPPVNIDVSEEIEEPGQEETDTD